MDLAVTAEAKLNASALAFHECSLFEDQIKEMDSSQLNFRAGRCHIDLSDFLLEEGFASHWEEGVHGSRYIRDKSFRELSKAVEIAEHDAKRRKIDVRDSWFKIGTAIAATMAAIASILNLFWHASKW